MPVDCSRCMVHRQQRINRRMSFYVVTVYEEWDARPIHI